MTPTEKISHRIALLQSLCTPRHQKRSGLEGQSFFVTLRYSDDSGRCPAAVYESELYAALARITDTRIHELDWLKEKAEDISQKGMLWFMGYLDKEHLTRLLDPAVDVFPTLGI